MAKKKNNSNNVLLWAGMAGLAGYIYFNPNTKETILAGSGGGFGGGSVPSSSLDIPQETQGSSDLDASLYSNNQPAKSFTTTKTDTIEVEKESFGSGSATTSTRSDGSSLRVFRDKNNKVKEITNPKRFQIGSSKKASIRDNVFEAQRDNKESDAVDEKPKKRFVGSSPFNSVRQNINEVLR